MSKYVNDVRTLSADPRHMGVVFTGSMKNAIKQAKAAPDHPLEPPYWPFNISRDRYRLLQHLNLMPKFGQPPKQLAVGRDVRPGLGKDVAPEQPGKLSLAYAKARGFI